MWSAPIVMLSLALALALTLGCAESSTEPVAAAADATALDLSGPPPDTGGSAAPDTGTADAEGDDAGDPADVPASDVPPTAGPDVTPPKPNAKPTIDPLSPIALKMGTSTTLDLRPLIADKEDADDALEVSWLSAHVALADDGDHVLLVVAPVDWFGVEPIIVTVTDTGGKAASATLNVTVDQVIVAPPPPDCDTTFSLAAPGATSVLVTGTFASWAQTAPPATTLTDPDGDSTFTGKVTLAAGTYQYKFIVNGVWKADPANPSTTPDGFGGVNSVLEVPTCP